MLRCTTNFIIFMLLCENKKRFSVHFIIFVRNNEFSLSKKQYSMSCVLSKQITKVYYCTYNIFEVLYILKFYCIISF